MPPFRAALAGARDTLHYGRVTPQARIDLRCGFVTAVSFAPLLASAAADTRANHRRRSLPPFRAALAGARDTLHYGHVTPQARIDLRCGFVTAVSFAPLLASAAADTRYARIDLRCGFVTAVSFAPRPAQRPRTWRI